LGNKSTKTLKVEDIKVLNMMLKGTKGNKKYIGDAMNIEVKKIVLYIYLKSRSLKSMVGRTLGDIRRKNLVYSLMQ
jgi:hypothetical protein